MVTFHCWLSGLKLFLNSLSFPYTTINVSESCSLRKFSLRFLLWWKHGLRFLLKNLRDIWFKFSWNSCYQLDTKLGWHVSIECPTPCWASSELFVLFGVECHVTCTSILGCTFFKFYLEVRIKHVFRLLLSWVHILLDLWQLLNMSLKLAYINQRAKTSGFGSLIWQCLHQCKTNRWGCVRSHALKWNWEVWFINNFCSEVSNSSFTCESGCLLLSGLCLQISL